MQKATICLALQTRIDKYKVKRELYNKELAFPLLLLADREIIIYFVFFIF